MNDLTDEQIAELRTKAEAATRGPWEASWMVDEGTLEVAAGTALTVNGTPPGSYSTTDMIYGHDDCWEGEGGEQREADADFIAAARNLVPALLDALATARTERDDQKRENAELRDELVATQEYGAKMAHDRESAIRDRHEAEAQVQAVRTITADIARVEHPHGIPADADCMCCLIHRALDGEAGA